MMATNIDDLWDKQKSGQRLWLATIPDDLTEWLEAIADRIIESGRTPNWTATTRRIREVWPDHCPARDTLQSTLRRLVKERG